MGTAIDRRAYKQLVRTLPQALFILSDPKYIPAGIVSISIGILLSDTLQNVSETSRAERLEDCFNSILPQIGDVSLCHIDILFDPAWYLDVLRLLQLAARNRLVYLVWPGTINGKVLSYAQPGFDDYKTFDINNYIDTYIVK